MNHRQLLQKYKEAYELNDHNEMVNIAKELEVQTKEMLGYHIALCCWDCVYYGQSECLYYEKKYHFTFSCSINCVCFHHKTREGKND